MRELDRFMLGRNVSLAELDKALWLAESQNFVVHGRPIGGAVYRHDESGAHARGTWTLTAETRRFERTSAPGRIEVSLSAEERESAEWALHHLHDPACTAIWATAEIGEVIPYHALLALRGRQPNADELAWAKLRAGEPAAQ